MKKWIFLFIALILSSSLEARVDTVDWTTLDSPWRKPLCLEESVYPLDGTRAGELADKIENQLKKENGVSKLVNLAYQKSQPTPDQLAQLRDIVTLRGLEAARSKGKGQNWVKTYSKMAYTVCERVLNKFPSTRCHDFLLVTIKPQEFIELVGAHFEIYQDSAIYNMDMRQQCQLQSPDWNCSELAKDYFVKNHLDSCLAGHLEPPEKLEPVSLLTTPSGH